MNKRNSKLQLKSTQMYNRLMLNQLSDTVESDSGDKPTIGERISILSLQDQVDLPIKVKESI